MNDCRGKEAKMIKAVSMWSVVALGMSVAAGCAVETDDGAPSTDFAEGVAEQAVTMPGKQLYCGLGRPGAVAAQRAATAFYQFLTAGNLAGLGNSATSADIAAYNAAGGIGNLGADTFTAFFPAATPNTTLAGLQAAKAANSAAAALKTMVGQGTLILGDPAPDSVCTLAAGIRGAYPNGISPSAVLGLITSFSTKALEAGYPTGLPYYLAVDDGTGGSGGTSGSPGGTSGTVGTSSGSTPPIVIRPVFYIDPEPARLFQNLSGSNGVTGQATYVNSGEQVSAYKWVSTPQLGTVPHGAPCSTSNIVAGTDIYKAIEVLAGGSRRCK